MAQETGTPERELTPKQEQFCQAYTTCWNATKAAKIAGYSEKSAGLQGYQLLRISIVQKRIEELAEHALKEMGVTRERILQEYTRLAFVDTSQAYDDAGFLKQIKDIPEDVRRAIAGVDSDEIFAGQGEQRTIIGHARKLKFYDKKGALDSLSKCLGMAPEKVEHSGPGGKPIQTQDLTELPDGELKARALALATKLGMALKEEG